jgi:hypothetical protein
MKLNCEVLEVATTGTGLKLKLQGQNPALAEWQEWLVIEIAMPTTKRTNRAFYVGRLVTIEMTPSKP